MQMRFRMRWGVCFFLCSISETRADWLALRVVILLAHVQGQGRLQGHRHRRFRFSFGFGFSFDFG